MLFDHQQLQLWLSARERVQKKKDEDETFSHRKHIRTPKMGVNSKVIEIESLARKEREKIVWLIGK